DDAISAAREAISISPPTDGPGAALLHTLAESLLRRFELTNQLADVQEALSLHRTALFLRPPGHVDRHVSILSLARALHTHFRHTGEPQNFTGSIQSIRDALLFFDPARHGHRAASLADEK
ncbi:uncharacterized protein PHACADRAFT_57139, partial [Phanerochaete carnosa HHB-10118-sp]